MKLAQNKSANTGQKVDVMIRIMAHDRQKPQPHLMHIMYVCHLSCFFFYSFFFFTFKTNVTIACEEPTKQETVIVKDLAMSK